MNAASTPEPYVGPRPFDRNDCKFFFGRDHEADDLLSLVLAHPVVLIYAASGAGKTSLLNAGLIPRLTDEDFQILGPARVIGPFPHETDRITNIHRFYALSKLNSDLSAPVATESELASLTLVEFFRRLEEHEPARPRALLFDQFEEFFTTNVSQNEQRRAFIEELAQASRAVPGLRVIFAMREEYVVRFEVFAERLPDKLRTRMRLEPLREGAAIEAIRGPVEKVDLVFDRGSDDPAKALVHELLKIRVDAGPNEGHEIIGEFVEPIQLQVVCQNMWRNFPDELKTYAAELQGLPPEVKREKKIITRDQVSVGDVDQALAQYYDFVIAEAVRASGAREGQLRRWFGWTLITAAGMRGIALASSKKTAQLPETALGVFLDRRLVRKESRAGSEWYELTHDRFIEAIQRSNRTWFEQRSESEALRSKLEAKAQIPGAFLDESETREAEFFLASPDAAMLDTSQAVEALVKASREHVDAENTRKARELEDARKLAESERARAENAQLLAAKEKQRAEEQLIATRRLRRRAIAMAILCVSSVATAVLSVKWAVEASRMRKTAQENFRDKKRQAKIAQDAAATATALKISWRGSNQAQTKLDLALLLSNQAVRKSQATLEARNALLTCLLSSPQLSTFLRGHKKTVFCLAFSPDGTTLASAGAEGNIILWSPYTGYMTQAPYKAHDGFIYSIAFSPNGKSLASASEDHTVKIWNVKTSEKIASLLHPDSVHAVAFTPDGTRLASAGADKTVRIWDVQTQQVINSLKDHKQAVHTVAFSADSKWLASAGDEQKIILWDAKTLKKKGVIEVEENDAPICKILFSPDSKSVLASSTSGVITTWNVASPNKNSKRFENHSQGVYGMDLSETELASASEDGTVKLRDPEGGEIKTLSGYSQAAYSVAFGSNGNMLAAGFRDGVIALWDFSQISPIAKRVDAEVNEIAVGPGGKKLAVAQGNSVVVCDVEQGTWLTPVLSKNALGVGCVAISPDGKTLASGSDDNTVRLWNIASGEQIGPPLRGHSEPVWSIGFSHDNKMLASGSYDNTVRLWNVETRKCKVLPGHRSVVRSVSFSSDNKQLASGSRDGTIRRWNVETGEEIGSPLINPDGEVLRVAFGAQAVACANITGGVTLWDFSAKKLRPRQLAPATALSSIAFDQEGRTLLSISATDGSVTRWDASTGKAHQNPPEAGGEMAAFSEFATYAAVASGRKITVSASASGTPFGQTIDTGPGEVVRIESTYDGDMIVASASGRITLLDSKTFQPKGKPLQLPADLADVASSPIADVLACASGKQVTIWDIKTNHQLGHVDLEASATRVIYSSDGKTFATGDEQGNVRLWDAKSLKRIALPVEPHKSRVIDLAFDPKQNVLLSIGKENDLIRQPLSRGQQSIRVREQNFSRIAVSPNGALVACGTNDGRVGLFDAISEQEVTPVAEQAASAKGFGKSPLIKDLVFSRDGKLLASSGVRNVQLWDVESRQQFGPPLTGFSSKVRALKFTADGKYLLTADEEGTLLRWAMNVQEWEKLASTIGGRQLTPDEWKQYIGEEPYEPFPDAWLALKEAVNASLADEPREKIEQAFQAAVKTAVESNDPLVNNEVCWQGSLRGFAPTVLPAGRRSFELAKRSDEKNVGNYQDTLALALALTHNTPAAIENFKAFVKWAKDHGAYDDTVAKREEWIRKLEDGKDPFTPETLKKLRDEVTSFD